MLEKTFEEWLQYRDECLRRMASEPYPAGTRPCPARGHTEPGLGFVPPPASSALVTRRVTTGTFTSQMGYPGLGCPEGLRLVWGTRAHFRVASAPSEVLG